MPKTIKSVSKGYLHNLIYHLEPRRFESIIKVIENSRDNLSKANVAHIIIQVDDLSFDKSLINTTLIQAIEKELDTGFGYYLAMEKSEYSGFHIHIMLTFSTASKRNFTILCKAVKALYSVDSINTAIAIPRKTDRSVSIDTRDYFNKFKHIKSGNKYFHDLNDINELKDAIHRYSYLAKDETKNGIPRSTQPKYPKAHKTKVGQKQRKLKVVKND